MFTHLIFEVLSSGTEIAFLALPSVPLLSLLRALFHPKLKQNPTSPPPPATAAAAMVISFRLSGRRRRYHPPPPPACAHAAAAASLEAPPPPPRPPWVVSSLASFPPTTVVVYNDHHLDGVRFLIRTSPAVAVEIGIAWFNCVFFFI
jgi:hypothetical protein